MGEFAADTIDAISLLTLMTGRDLGQRPRLAQQVAQLAQNGGGEDLPLVLRAPSGDIRAPDQVVRMAVQRCGDLADQPGPVELDPTALDLGHPALGLAEFRSEIGLRHSQAQPLAPYTAADRLTFLQHRRLQAASSPPSSAEAGAEGDETYVVVGRG